MSTVPKAPVEVVQELIAVHTTRKEVVEKIRATGSSDTLSTVLSAAEKQSNEFIKALLNELSGFGDGVMEAVEREDDYYRVWKNAMGNLAAATPGEIKEIFFTLEDCLKNKYQHILETQPDLPPEIAALVGNQLNAIQQEA